MTVTEIGLMGVKPNLNIMDESTPEGQMLAGAYKAIFAAPGGPSQIYYGLEIENPLYLWAFFEWDSLEEHEKFAKSFGGEAVKDFPKILTHGEFTKHVTLTSSPSVLRSPVTEVMLAYHSSDISPIAKDKAIAQLQHFIEKGLSKCDDVKGVSYGWGVENDFPVRGEKGQKGAVLTAFVGWDSIEEHEKFREIEATEAFRENVGSLDMEGIVKLEMFHISCTSLGKKME